MNRDHFIVVTIVLVAALAVGASYFYEPAQVVNNESITVPPDTAIITSTSTAPVATSTEPRAATFRELATGTHAANVDARKNIAVYSQAELANLWRMAHGANSAAPKIDFNKEYVIGVFAGQKNTGGYAIAVTSVVDTGTTRTVTVTLTSPGTDCFVTQALTSPFQIIAVPASIASLAHKDVAVAKSCN